MNLNLDSKRALVTGSSSGIGEAIAKTLAKEGAAVAVNGRNVKEVTRVVREIENAGGRAFSVVGDLATDGGAKQVAERAVASLGGVDVLVNNAGQFFDRGWTETTTAQWSELYNANVLSIVRLVQHLVPGMRERGFGRLVQIASAVSSQPFARMADYSATKAAIVNVSVSLAKELTGTGVTANTVSPGPIRTAGFEEFVRSIASGKGWGEDWSAIEKRFVAEMAPNPAGRIGTVDDVASLVAFLASPLAGYVNGANLRVDGGYVVTTN